ncbi:MAG: hypothetical protein PHW50_00865 [Patescibacteria group bacterium]|nr:hypothetical protein [Patescibacteria group bacterium]
MAKMQLEDILASKTQAKLISFFLENSKKEFYQSELKNLLNESLGSLQYELARLKRIDFLSIKRTKIRTYYKLNGRFLLINEIKKIVSKVGTPKVSPKKTTKKATAKKNKK